MALRVMESILYANDLEAVRPFYCDLLGLELTSYEAGRHAFFRCDGSMLLVFNPESTRNQTVLVKDAIIPRHGAEGPGHLAFQISTEEMQPLLKRMTRMGVEIESEICWPNGAKSIYVRDPAGNSIEFATPDLWFK